MMVETASTAGGRPITAAEFDALPIDTTHRYEIEDGFLLVNARPAAPHSRAIKRLLGQLDSQLPAGLEAFAELEAELIGRSPRRVPDVVVAGVEVGEQQRVRADQIVVAIEIATSGESAVRDYAIKAGEYAANAIGHYWVIDILDPASVGLTVYTLDEGEYRITPRATGSVALATPFPLTVDLDALVGSRIV